MSTYANRVHVLRKMEHLKEDGSLTWKGLFATHIYSHELLISELVFGKILENLSCAQINSLLAAIEYEPRLNDKFRLKGTDVLVGPILTEVEKNNFVAKKIKKMNLKKMSKIFSSWSSGCEFEELTDFCNLAEGDLIRLFRRVIDVLRQIFKALDKDSELKNKISKCMDLLDRDLVKVEF